MQGRTRKGQGPEWEDGKGRQKPRSGHHSTAVDRSKGNILQQTCMKLV